MQCVQSDLISAQKCEFCNLKEGVTVPSLQASITDQAEPNQADLTNTLLLAPLVQISCVPHMSRFSNRAIRSCLQTAFAGQSATLDFSPCR